MATEKKKEFTTLDIYLSAFLALQGIQPELKLNNGRVTFNFVESDDLHRLSMAYNLNDSVPVVDFVTRIKILRGQMLTMRDSVTRPFESGQAVIK